MARAIRFSAALILSLAPAAPALAADTGMLYVKSIPEGATAVIEGKERGKTPVLVRDLPPGEVTVELRIAGVKPVTKIATVEANKVVTIDVAIEVPSATLTVVSEPLEATVILDGRDVGKTPTTLEDLQPGPHELILLKDGHPRTVRSVVLEPGSQRVLEVKLGTAGGDEAERPAAGESAAKAQGPGRVPVEVQLILTMLKEAVDKGDYSEARRNLTLALGQPEMAKVKEELRAAIGVVQALEAREDAIRDGADALVGKEVVLKTRTGARKGRVESVSVEGITVVRKIIVGGRAAGESRGVVKWSALAPEEQGRLAASWKPEGPDGAVARAILAQARKDKAAAARALAAAREHPLGEHLGGGDAAAAGLAQEDLAKIWARIERKYTARRMTAAEELAFDRTIRAFKDTYGKAGLDPSLRRRIRLAAERAKRASGLVGHWTFDGGGGSVVRDWSGRGKHGRIQGGVRWVKGKIGAALAFDGVSGHVCLPDGFADFRSGFTVAVWANPTSQGSWARFIDFGNGPDGENIVLTRDDTSDTITLEVKGGSAGNTGVPATDAIDLNRWQHFAAAIDASGNAVVYKDGVRVGAGTAGVPAVAVRTRNYTGRSNWAGGFYEGRMDDVRIYDRALHPTEVKALAIQGD